MFALWRRQQRRLQHRMPRGDREACTLARWIIKTKAKEVDPGQMARRSCCPPDPIPPAVFPRCLRIPDRGGLAARATQRDLVSETPPPRMCHRSESRCEPIGPPPIWTNASTPQEATSHHPTDGGPLCGNDDECLAYVPGSSFLLPNGTPDLREVRLSQ
jgi:hypothetical protein